MNQPLTTLTANRPPDSWSAVAPSLASTPGFQRPGRTAAMTLSRSVASSSARLKEVDSCWYSAP
ncbi:hypothetical protein ADK46_08350 [Streptomyces rimosus subsp. rimosus]|nr:hypothetical protein ADK45_13440 [Streptomyces rimosus subsp. rimosus]KUJ40918.1 hypothetical protein ADK46_08350 [Streptomyces rimosus subsp. rimosus]